MAVAMAGVAGRFLLGDQFTAADVVVGSGVQWGTLMKSVPERPEFSAYLGRLRQRPALQRAFARNQELYAKLHPAA